MDKILQIYTATDNKGGVQNFPYIDEEPLRIVDFSFSGSRMEIPTLTASVKHKECLDSKWNYKQFIEFRGEKYWVSKIPSSSKDNTDHRYKHDITFVSERNILSNIYFYDIVDAESESGKYHSNSSKVLFYGTISELVDRINASLKYSGVDYVVSIKEGEIPADKLAVTKEFSCENVFVFDALKQAFETWDIPFYFVGKNCYFGFGEELGKDSLKYGKNNGLLKIERTNGNTRIITRATGLGSTENIPFYYPNMSEKGDFTFTLKRKDGTIIPVEIIDQNKVATTIPDGVTYEFTDKSEYSNAYINTIEVQTAYGEPWKDFFLGDYVSVSLHDDPHSIRVWFTVDNFDNVIFDFRLNTENHGSFQLKDFKSISLYDAETNQPIQTWFGLNTSKITTDFKNGLSGSYYFLLSELDIFRGGDIIDEEYQYTFETVTISTVTSKEETTKIYKWIPKDVDNARNFTSLKYLGIDYVETEADLEGTFVMNIIPNSKVPYQERLMPSIFSRGTAFNGNVTATRGVERFYNAKNSTYPNIEFTNELNEFNRSENIYQYDDIKPSIAKVTNANGELIGQVLDVAFDKNDNDDVYGEEYGDKSNNYIHPYFYIKLHTFDGDLGFNLFNRATEKDSMTIQMTSGDLNGCKFKIQVIDKGNNVFANPVQVYTQADVDKEGSTITEDMIGQIVAGDSDKKTSRSNFIESQQDTRKNEVWIAILKDTDTFGTILPNSVTNLVVKIGDTFNITGIHMPESYILAAEQWLDESIVSDMADENIEAFNFAIDFSRIFLQEDYETNKENSWVAKLTESVRIPVEYNGRAYQQYVTSYTYECKGAELLPKISVGLSNTIAKSESYADAIVKKSTTTITHSTPRIVKTQIANSNLAVKSNTLSGYGITDAKIEDDGTLVLGTASVVIPKETKSLDWSQITNKPDYFELDENGDVKVKGGKGLWTESFLSTKGASIDTGTGGDGSGGIGINAMWTELAREDSSRIIDYSHMPSSVKTAINWVSSVTGSDADSQINKWNEIISFLSGISDTSSLSSILRGKANTSAVEELSDDVSALSTHITNILARKVNAGTGLTGGGTLNADVTLSLATIGTAGTYTKVVVDAYGRVTGNSALLASDIPQLEMGQINGLANELEAYSQLIESSVQESEFAAFFAQEMAKWFVLDSENKGIKTANGYGFYSESYISSKGLSDDTTGGSGIDVSSLWAELADDGTEQIAKNHLVDALNGYATQSWVTSQNYLTEITKSSIISALGYTPFNASNFTKSNIQSTLGISDWALASTKPSYTKSDVGLGNVSNLAATEYLTNLSSDTTNAVSITIGGTSKNISVGTMRTSLGLGSFAYKSSLAFADLTSKPTTLSGYGITDAYTKAQVNTELGKYLSLAGGKMANTNLVTNLNADLLDGVHLADVYRKSGWYRVVPYINNGGIVYHYWFKVAQINYTTTSGLAELELAAVSDANYMYSASARLTIKGYSGNPSCSVSLTSNAYLSTRINVALDKDGGVWVKSNCSWNSYLRWRAIVNDEGYTGITILDGSTKQLDQPINSCVIEENTGATYRQSKDAFETAWAAFNVGIGSFKSYSAQIKILPYNDSAYIEFGNADFTNNVPAFITGYSSNPLNLLTISSHSTIFTGSVTIGGANGVTLSFDATNDMLKFSKGGYFLGAVSTKGVSAETGTGGTGVALSTVWDSLANNTDVYGSTKIHIDHIPTLTTSKISDFPTLVSAFANDAGYITASAIINKADKATTLAGYGITDAVTLNTEQTITRVKTFTNGIKTPIIVNQTSDNALFIGATDNYYCDLNTQLSSGYSAIIPRFQKIGSATSTTGDFGSARKGVIRLSGNASESQLLFDHYNATIHYRGSTSNGAFTEWKKLAFKETTLSGYGITDAVPFLNMVNASNLKSIGVGYVNANGANGENGGIISFGSVSHQTQIHSDYPGGNIHWRVNSNGTLTNWKNLLDANNYSNYAVTLDTAQTITGEKIFQQGTGNIPLRIRNTTDFAFIQAGSSGTNNTASLAISGLNVSNLTSLQVYATNTSFYGSISTTKISGITDSSMVANLNANYLGGFASDRILTTHNGASHNLAESFTEKSGGSYVMRIGGGNAPTTNSKYGNILHVEGLWSDTSWELLAGWNNNELLFRSGNTSADGNGIISKGWKSIPLLTDDTFSPSSGTFNVNSYISVSNSLFCANGEISLGTDGLNISPTYAYMNIGNYLTVNGGATEIHGDYFRIGAVSTIFTNSVNINGNVNLSSMMMTNNDTGVLTLDGNYIDVYAPMNVKTSLTIGQATISWDSVNGMLKVDTGAYFTGPVSTKGVSGGSGLVAVAQFGITWHDAWAIDVNSTYVESFGTTNKSISEGQGTTNGSTIEIVSDAFAGKKIGDIEIFTLGWENEAPANVRLAPYKISGNTLYCALLLSGTMSQATFKIKIY